MLVRYLLVACSLHGVRSLATCSLLARYSFLIFKRRAFRLRRARSNQRLAAAFSVSSLRSFFSRSGRGGHVIRPFAKLIIFALAKILQYLLQLSTCLLVTWCLLARFLLVACSLLARCLLASYFIV